MIENQEIDYSKLSEILAETEEPAFFKCFFNGTALRSLKAENAVFNDCKMSNIDFSYSDFNGAVFRNCDLNNCNFNGCRLFDAKFENCKLSGSDFSDTSNLNCEFEQCQLCYCFMPCFNFKKLTLRELNFNGAELNDCDFRDTIWEDCSMREAVIRQCRFKGADLRGCDLGGLTFSEAANLKGAYISKAQASDILAALTVTVL